MSTLQQASLPLVASAASRSFLQQLGMLLDALLQPRDVIAEVEQWRKLHLEANRVESSQPLLAAQLRRSATMLGFA